jgi:L-serine/L-threonine ammonia-lyase
MLVIVIGIGSAVIHPFDDPLIWEGHSSIVSEIQSQLGGGVADVIIASVGGGGLMNGILEGMDKVGWSHVPFIAMETIGADSLNACVKAGEWVELDAITSMAKCLGARRVCWKSYESLLRDNVTSCVVSDNDAMRASIMMADDLGIYVPLACGAALAAVTTPSVIRDLQKSNKLPAALRNVVVIACGGSGVDNDIINHWRSLIID